MTTVNASKVALSPAFCKGNINITSMNLKNIPFISNCMHKAFYGCTALTSVTNINSNVVDMSSTFTGCNHLASAPTLPPKVKTLAGTMYKDTLNVGGTFANTAITAAPTIVASVTNMLGTFANCTSLVSAGIIPLGVTDMRFCYSGCNHITTAPTIPSSVTDVQNTYAGCTALTGDVMIMSSIITNATNCFAGTSATKNVYIPFTYANNVYTATYNSFIAAGYSTSGSQHGVTLKNLNS